MTNGGFDLGHFCWLSWEQKNFFGRIQFQCLRDSVKIQGNILKDWGALASFGNRPQFNLEAHGMSRTITIFW